LFHNANLFGSCIIHILYTGCAKIKENNSGAKGLMDQRNFVQLYEILDTNQHLQIRRRYETMTSSPAY